MHPDADLIGHVDIVSDERIQGWALNRSDPRSYPLLEVIQSGRPVCAVAPSRSYPELLPVLNLSDKCPADGLYAWTIPAPLTLGVRPDEPFDIRFVATGQPLANGSQRQIPRFSAAMMSELEKTFDRSVVMLIPHFGLDGDTVLLSGTIYNWPPNHDVAVIHACGDTFHADVRESKSAVLLPDRNWFLPGRTVNFSLDTGLTKARFATDQHGALLRLDHPSSPIGSLREWHHSLRNSFFLPANLFDNSIGIPPAENIARVTGDEDTLRYRLGGATRLFQLNELSKRWSGRELVEHDCVVEWGVGCARVLRHMWESREIFEAINRQDQRLIGIDVDEVNLSWCKANLSPHAEYLLADFEPPLAIASRSVDFLFGISVMTHLTERSQIDWLREIERVMRPGGLVVLTANCEWAFLRAWDEPIARSVDWFGFGDCVPDPAIGDANTAKYRWTCQTTRHIKENWGRILPIRDVIPCSNCWTMQDMIIAQAP